MTSQLKRLAHKAKGIVGSGEQIGETEEFLSSVQRLKTGKGELEALMKEATKYREKQEEAAQQGRRFAMAMQTAGDESDHGKALMQAAQMQMALEDLRMGMLDRFTRTVTTPFQEFLDNEYKDFEKARKAYETARTDYEIALGEVKEQKNKEKVDPQRLYAAEVRCSQAKTKFEVLAGQVEDAVTHIQTKRDHALMENVQSQIRVYTEFFDSSAIYMSQQMGSYAATLDGRISQHASNIKTMKKERADGKMMAIDRQRRGRYFPLVEILGENRLDLLGVLAEDAGSSGDDIISTSIVVLDAFGLMQGLIKTSVEREVTATSLTAPQTLFRLNSISTRLVTCYTKLVARPWVVDVLRPCLAQLTSKPDRSFEINESKLTDDDNLDTNIKKLILATQFFLNAILGSVEACPLVLRRMFRAIHQAVNARFENTGRQAVSAFVFLRIFCPAIAAPQMYDIAESANLTPQIRRALLLITKCITNLANGVEFGAKEPYMTPLNVVIQQNMEAVGDFLAAVTDVPDNADPAPALASVEQVEQNQLPQLHRSLVKSVDRISQKLMENQGAVVNHTHLAEVLGQLGPVKE